MSAATLTNENKVENLVREIHNLGLGELGDEVETYSVDDLRSLRSELEVSAQLEAERWEGMLEELDEVAQRIHGIKDLTDPEDDGKAARVQQTYDKYDVDVMAFDETIDGKLIPTGFHCRGCGTSWLPKAKGRNQHRCPLKCNAAA